MLDDDSGDASWECEAGACDGHIFVLLAEAFQSIFDGID